MIQKFQQKLIFLIPMVLIAGFLLNNQIFAEKMINQNDEYLAFAEEMPEVEGGLPNLYKSIRYPDIARKAGISGRVYVMAFIDESGNVNDVQVIKGIGGGCDEAAVEAIRKTKFIPGKNKGQAVKVKLSLPINFQLQ